MSVEINANESIEVSAPTTIVANKIRVSKVLLDFENVSAMANISFGVFEDDVFTAKKQELWYLTGSFFEDNKDAVTSGGGVDDEVKTACAGLINAIQNTPGLKASLLASKQLMISQNDIHGFMS